MHELGVVFHIADSVVKTAEENEAVHVHSVTLELGEVSGVIPEYLTDVWQWNCKRTPLLNGCTLEIVTIPAVTFCESCGRTYPTVVHGRTCPLCGSDNTWLKQGNEVIIKEILID